MQGADELTARDRDILREVVHTYLLTAEPVSSRTVARREGQDLSPASIRNSMADLDDLGLLTQPHTSAGRVPTPAGWHVFIQSLMEIKNVSINDRRKIHDALDGAQQGDEAMAAVSHLLKELSDQIAIVVTPAFSTTVLERIEFVPLSGARVLCVCESSGGFIDNKVIESESTIERAELIRIANYLNDNFKGFTLTEIRARLVQLMEDERLRMDTLLRKAVQFAERGLPDDPSPGVLVEGTESLLHRPELADLHRVQTLFDTFTDKVRLVSMLGQCVEGEGVRVWIGDESDLTSALDFSLIVKQYGSAGGTRGSVGVFGPSRMEYPRLIPLVDYLGERLSDALSKTL